jgi:hypothetical protein
MLPSPRIASAPAVSAGAADAGEAGEGPGVRGPLSPREARPREVPSSDRAPIVYGSANAVATAKLIADAFA